MLPYALAIFTGAFLLFEVQPLIGKYILPWFGGSPGVWTTCLLFFQLVLLGGYAYAHLIATRLRPRSQVIVHGILLAASLLVLPITPSPFWKDHVAGNPTWHILLLLAGTIGLPYFVLSATGPLMQQWFSVSHRGASPYRLYALSNVGSLLALLSYPVYFEVRFSRPEQARLWSTGLGVFAVLAAVCAWQLWKASGNGAAAVAEPPASPVPETDSKTPGLDRFLWVALPATASILLLAVTNKLCQDVAVIPFLWVLPLGLYLLSFVISFDHARWYSRPVFTALAVVAVAVVFQMLELGNDLPIRIQIACYLGALFVFCMIGHGEVYRLKPPPRSLTAYYLAIAAGGALGGILVAIVAPAVFNDFHELPLGLWLLTYLAGVVCFRQASRPLAFAAAVGGMLATFVIPVIRAQCADGLTVGDEWLYTYSNYGWFILAGLAVFLACAFDRRTRDLTDGWTPRLGAFVMVLSVAVGAVVVIQWTGEDYAPVVDSARNFYGTLKVFDHNRDDPLNHYYLLLHGVTTHGLQFTAEDRAMFHTTYYGERSGVGLAIDHLTQPAGRRRIGLVGLGTGTLVSYGTPGDYFRIYEINPAVEKLARTRFTYLRRCPATVDIITGDARLSMEREIAENHPQQLDLLALDAFSSDAIPVHLLTREAFALYLKELKPDGILAVHTSNRYLDLRPVVERLADEFGLMAKTVFDDDEPNWWTYRTTWILVTKNQAFLDDPDIIGAAELGISTRPHPLWTDDHVSLFPILR
ncbi:MAG TPA: fused MFS/spermidine synthase [Opitutaceae bacterium]|nr:fused MFS/spermidine synthase [Opitutaceae bacterium]